MNYVYILECEDGSYYTGWTNNIVQRYKAHQAGRGAKYTKSHKPMRIVHLELFAEKRDAMKREYAIKHMSRTEKEKLIACELKK
ncbi:MAG: GIY-YIG nuclease family protein [Erysipelotrichaceae bacterium]|nr:GIY-YIG nuclease family protein [Erysipelotrichaceae bacterium]